MNKLIIFDLDGVLIESRELHYDALNDALRNIDKKYVIKREEHLSVYDGLSTTKKLELLTTNKNLPQKYYNQIWQDKQTATFDLIKEFPINDKLISIFKEVKSRGYKIAIASNSIRETVKLALLSIGVMEYVDYYVSNEDVKRPKPYPEMYWKCMTEMYANPSSTIIIEDSHIGRLGAITSGANLLPVENTMDLTLEKVVGKMNEMDNVETKNIPWRDSKLNVLIPMAGAGSRLTDVDSYKKVKSVGDFLENVDDASRRAMEVKGSAEGAGISFA
jgi:HAD superfamily hydrolase (TIGR01509 family)